MPCFPTFYDVLGDICFVVIGLGYLTYQGTPERRAEDVETRLSESFTGR